MGKLDDLFDQAEGKSTLDALFDQAEAAPAPEFMQPRPIPGIPGMGGEKLAPYRVTRPADIPAAPPKEDPGILDMVLPSAMAPRPQRQTPRYAPDSSGRIDGYVPTTESKPFAPIGDLAGLPTRALGVATDPILPGNARGDNPDGSRKTFAQGMANPDAGIMRPVREKLGQAIASQWEQATDDEKPYLLRAWHALMAEAGGAAYAGASAAEDPTVLIPGVAGEKIAAGAERVLPTLQKAGNAVAEAPRKLALNLTSATTDIPAEALQKASTAQGRAELQSIQPRLPEIQNKFLDMVDNFKTENLPENQIIDQALTEKGYPISTESMARAGEAALPKPVDPRLGPSPDLERVRSKVQPWIDYVRGGPVPEDLSATAAARATDAAAAGKKAESLAPLAEEAATQAERDAALQARTQSKAAKAAGQAGATKKAFLNTADLADKNVTRWGGARNEAGQAAESALEAAQAAAKDAREGYLRAQVSGAVAGVRGDALAAAEKTLQSANRNYAVADAAAQLNRGRSLQEVTKGLIADHGLKGEDLRNVLGEAKARFENLPAKPDVSLPPVAYRRLRAQLDRKIDRTNEDYDAVNSVFKAMRTQGKNELLQMAKNADIEGYPEWMKSLSQKYQRLSDLKSMLGKSSEVRERRIESFFRNALKGANPEYKRQLFADIDQMSGNNFSKDVKDLYLSRSLGPNGVAPWLPPQHNGASLKALAYLKTMAVPIGSPKIATRVTLPFLQGLENVLKFTGGKLTAKSQAALRAAMKTRSAVVQMRLLNLIENEIPSNAVPFKRVAGAEPDRTQTNTSRYAGR